MIEWLGIFAVISMVVSYALEDRHPVFVLIFATSCALAAIYAYMIASYPFLFAEGTWAMIAFRRWLMRSKIAS